MYISVLSKNISLIFKVKVRAFICVKVCILYCLPFHPAFSIILLSNKLDNPFSFILWNNEWTY